MELALSLSCTPLVMLLIPVTFSTGFPLSFNFHCCWEEVHPKIGNPLLLFPIILSNLEQWRRYPIKLSAYGEQLTIWCCWNWTAGKASWSRKNRARNRRNCRLSYSFLSQTGDTPYLTAYASDYGMGHAQRLKSLNNSISSVLFWRCNMVPTSWGKVYFAIFLDPDEST